ncbi:MAG: hypothetical protein ABSG51_04030 [Terracidiphilus sp.]
MPIPLADPNSVFLNIPYDEEFQKLYLAYVVGLYQLGLVPNLTSEIPGGDRRLERILALIQSCRYSIHDLSRIELSAAPQSTPRFNMPLELGLTITWEELHPECHTWFVWESENYRLQTSLSDLNGTDPYIHGGTVEGVLSELRSAFIFKNAPPFGQMMDAYTRVERKIPRVLATTGTANLYSASVFKDICFVALDVTRSIATKGKR